MTTHVFLSNILCGPRLFLLAVLTFLPAAYATAQPVDYNAGVHYQELSVPVPTVDPDRIEVREIFWYGCPQCFTFQPMMLDWEREASGDIAFLRVPAVWNKVMETHARIFYTAGSLGVSRAIHQAAFDAIHQENNPLRTVEQVKALFAAQGVGAARFEQAWHSEEVAAGVEAAGLLTEDYGVRRLPAMIVNGKYRVMLNDAVPEHQEMVKAVNMLIKKERNR